MVKQPGRIGYALLRARYALSEVLPRHRRTHRIGAFVLELDNKHALPRAQRMVPTYDRFLPHLAAQLPADGTVVDVGANIGDSIAGMASANPRLGFLAVEPDAIYFGRLQRNIRAMIASEPLLSIEARQCFISNELPIASVSNVEGTGRLVMGETSAAVPNIKLDELLLDADRAPLSLIKIDVDGYDWSVIDSGRATIEAARPAIFFECYFGGEEDLLQSYGRTLSWLTGLGYRLRLFDNYGIPIAEIGLDAAMDAMRYVLEQDLGRAKRTVHYYDILATPPSMDGLVQAALASFAQERAGAASGS